MADVIHDSTIIGLFVVALVALAQAYRIARRNGRELLAKKEREASAATKEAWSKRMETTKAEHSGPRTLRRWPG
jgi:hypothetical protein